MAMPDSQRGSIETEHARSNGTIARRSGSIMNSPSKLEKDAIQHRTIVHALTSLILR